MVLVDTSIWIDHLRGSNRVLKELLFHDRVLTHPFVVGELACGMIRNRKEVLDLVQAIPSAHVASDAEVLELIEYKRLYGQGIGWSDVHLIASALLSHASLLTLDKRLLKVAKRLHLTH